MARSEQPKRWRRRNHCGPIHLTLSSLQFRALCGVLLYEKIYVRTKLRIDTCERCAAQMRRTR